jgi:hypothetical protein
MKCGNNCGKLQMVGGVRYFASWLSIFSGFQLKVTRETQEKKQAEARRCDGEIAFQEDTTVEERG